jgi:hypothetical protein
MTRPVILVRFRPGVVGERRRTIHVVPIPEGDVPPVELTALCGQVFRPGTAERLDSSLGMPCDICFMVAAPLGAGPSSRNDAERN